MNEDIDSDLHELAQARVYFGRHSVGRNIVDGLERLAAENGVDGLRVVELDSESLPPAGSFFAHSRVGENRDAKSKIDGFAHRIRSGLPAEVDVALMKLCYVDFDPHTDVDEIFACYRSALDQLSAEFPRVRFLHATVPLMTRKFGPKERLKVLLGKALWRDQANVKREEFSERLRRSYDRNAIVDIARVESTNPDGTPAQFTVHGEQYRCLSRAYTSDGGHLNDVGGRKAAAEMVRVLARNIRRRG